MFIRLFLYALFAFSFVFPVAAKEPPKQPAVQSIEAGAKKTSVQAPEKKAVPRGASAQCRDGSYSFSKNRRGTCSHHGGVGQWL